MREDWADSLHILSDFDRTLTYGTVNGIKTPTLISLLRDGKHLREDYAPKAHTLFDHYHPFEIDPHMSIEEKKPLMVEWWHKHFSLMIECGLRKSDVHDVIKKSHLTLRKDADKTLQLLHEHGIPTVIISAWAIGDAIGLFLASQGLNFPTIFSICNQFTWSADGRAIGIQEPMIHVFNKDETSIEAFPHIYAQIEHRKNVILLGDSLWDIGMVHGFNYKNLLKIGFLNSDDEALREQYLEAFDVIIDHDGDFSFVLKCLEDILQ